MGKGANSLGTEATRVRPRVLEGLSLSFVYKEEVGELGHVAGLCSFNWEQDSCQLGERTLGFGEFPRASVKYLIYTRPGHHSGQ